VAPEKELAFFSKNLESISSAISVFRIIRKCAPDFCSKVKMNEIEHLSSGLSKICADTGLKSGIDTEIDRCSLIYERLNEAVARAETRAALEFGSLIEKSSVTVKGFDLLTAMQEVQTSFLKRRSGRNIIRSRVMLFGLLQMNLDSMRQSLNSLITSSMMRFRILSG